MTSRGVFEGVVEIFMVLGMGQDSLKELINLINTTSPPPLTRQRSCSVATSSPSTSEHNKHVRSNSEDFKFAPTSTKYTFQESSPPHSPSPNQKTVAFQEAESPLTKPASPISSNHTASSLRSLISEYKCKGKRIFSIVLLYTKFFSNNASS